MGGETCCQQVTELDILPVPDLVVSNFRAFVLISLAIHFTLQDRYLQMRGLNDTLVTFTCVHTRQASQQW